MNSADNIDRREGIYEFYEHGSARFPIGMHKTIFPQNPHLSDGVTVQILYTHWHSEFEFFYLSRGDCTFYIDGASYEMHPGDAAFVPSNVTHWATRSTSSKETVFYAVVFSPQLISDSAVDVVNEKYVMPVINGEIVFEPVYRRDVPWQSDVLDMLIEIMTLYDYTPYDNDINSERHPQMMFREDAVCAELTVKSLLFSIWKTCVMHAAHGKKHTRADKTNHERIQRALEYIHEHYGETISLADIASSVYMSREYFTHVFRDCTNTSPFSYLNNYRISRAMEMLERTDKSVIEIASACGFNQVSYFNRRFSELVKCTPTEYRRGRKQ